MCGIAGIAGSNDGRQVTAMLDRIRHRGPDDWGVYVSPSNDDGGVAIGNVRLSIIDLSTAGHQPMANEDGSIWVAYNGEIYNFPELRKELEADGHQFRSHTDTEVLPHLYEKYGADMVNHLNGIFAFALWDARLRTLFLFRDRIGVKPLYYAQVGRRLYFGSEIKALLACPEVNPELDPIAMQEYLALLYVPNPGSIFKSIHKLSPAHWLSWRDGQISVSRYWDMQPGEFWRNSPRELAEELRDILMRATRRQLISDVPVGFFLSGGLDSSTLVACAAKAQIGAIRCYSIGFTEESGKLEQSADDASWAKVVARHFGAEFHELVVKPDIIGTLPKVVHHLEDAVADPSAIATYLISEAAKPEVKVLLSGQGGDEIFGGYRVYLAPRIARALRVLPRAFREGPGIALFRRLARYKDRLGIHPGLVLATSRFGQRMMNIAGMSDSEQHVWMRSYLHYDDLRQLLTPEVQSACAGCDYARRLLESLDRAKSQDPLNRMMYLDSVNFMPDLNLDEGDKLSMACSIEVRVPLLDNEVVDFMMRVPPRLKLHGLTTKYLLRRAMTGVVPQGVIKRRKAGFGLPIRSWLRNDLREMVNDLLSEGRVRRRGLMNPSMVSYMLRENERGERDFTLSIWSLLVLEIWQQLFIDSAPGVNASESAIRSQS